MQERERFPPKVPEELPALERAIMLLGERAKGNIKLKLRDELAHLLGHAPKSEEQAAAWKSELKRMRQELLSEGVFDDE